MGDSGVGMKRCNEWNCLICSWWASLGMTECTSVLSQHTVLEIRSTSTTTKTWVAYGNYKFRALINSLACWFCTSALNLFLFKIFAIIKCFQGFVGNISVFTSLLLCLGLRANHGGHSSSFSCRIMFAMFWLVNANRVIASPEPCVISGFRQKKEREDGGCRNQKE